MLTERQFTDAAERYLDMVYRIALNWFRNPADAEDAAQNAMLRLWRTDTEFQGEDHLRHWLVRVALNECKRILRGLQSGRGGGAAGPERVHSPDPAGPGPGEAENSIRGGVSLESIVSGNV